MDRGLAATHEAREALRPPGDTRRALQDTLEPAGGTWAERQAPCAV
jgi:hypothetical protein